MLGHFEMLALIRCIKTNIVPGPKQKSTEKSVCSKFVFLACNLYKVDRRSHVKLR